MRRVSDCSEKSLPEKKLTNESTCKLLNSLKMKESTAHALSLLVYRKTIILSEKLPILYLKDRLYNVTSLYTAGQ
jgi:hypothetical protein